MSMLVYDPNNVQPVYCERNGYEAILIQQPIRPNTLAPDECSRSVRACARSSLLTQKIIIYFICFVRAGTVLGERTQKATFEPLCGCK